METPDDSSSIHNLVLPSTFILLSLATVGIYGNGCLIYATVRFRYLQSPCNILIALLALADLIHQLGHFPYAFVVFSGITFISHRVCFWLQLIPFLAMQYSISAILCLGIDRFYCIIRPFRYRSMASSPRAKIVYTVAVNILPILSAVVLATVAFTEMEEIADKSTLCLISAFIAGLHHYEYLWYCFNLFLAASCTIVYLVNWIIMWKISSAGTNVRKTLKPMTIILFLTFFGWFTLMVIMLVIITRKELPANVKIGYSSYAGIGVNATISANYFVYKYFSSDYKKGFRELWSRKKSDVSTIQLSSR